jgi:hypothetical protein
MSECSCRTVVGKSRGYELVQVGDTFILYDCMGRLVPTFSSEDARSIFDAISEADSAPATEGECQ